ncbi:MAG: HD domain-containing protein, partial [bacterium]|nr:HD domain-containing protein [bacterium]
IISHVKEGVELGRQYLLPQRVIDIIEQHQGDMVLNQFYNRALEEPRKEKINESEFKYPGPKPIMKEAAIVMLADKIEAMSKLLKEPTHKNIKEMVMDSFKKLLLDDQQFQDCNILLSNLYKVVNAMIVTLDGMYHSRIEYETDKKKENNGNGKE